MTFLTPFKNYSQTDLEPLTVNSEILALLIETALQNSPQIKAGSVKKATYEYEKKMVNNDWLGTLRVGGNLNEFSIKQFGENSGETSNQFFPRYNFGVSVPFNLFSDMKNEKKIIEQKNILIEYQTEELQRLLKETVTKQYIELLKYKKILAVKRNLEHFITADLHTKEEKFSNGSMDLAEYFDAKHQRALFNIEILEAESHVLRIEAELESTIGVELDSIIN